MKNKEILFTSKHNDKINKLYIMKNTKWVHDSINARVIDENDTIAILYTDKLHIPNTVIDKIVKLHNIGKGKEIDKYLLNEPFCSQEQREIIMENIYKKI